MVIEAKTESVNDPPDPKSPLFDSTGLSAAGVGSIMTSPARSRSLVPVGGTMRMASSQTSAAIQVVVVHGTTAADGHLIEAEIVTSTDASINQRDWIKQVQDRASRFNSNLERLRNPTS